MSDLEDLMARANRFRDEREWRQFHSPEKMAISLTLEAAEVLEHFQWKRGPELEAYLSEHKEDVSDELVDVLYWVLLIADDLNIDLKEAFERKMKKNEEKYPLEKAKGEAKKYTEL